MACSAKVVQLLAHRLTVSAFILLLATCAARGQITNVDDTTSTPVPGAGHDYIHLLSETVNPANGSVSLRISLPLPKDRGLTLSFSLDYDSNSVHHLVGGVPRPGYASWQSNSGYLSQGGWNYSVPMVSAANWEESDGSYPTYYNCDTWSNYMFLDPSGGQHALNLATQLSYGAGDCSKSGLSNGVGGDPVVSAQLPSNHPDNTNPHAVPYNPVTVLTADGTVYTFSERQYVHELPTSDVRYWLPTTIEDRNGNILSVTDNNNGNFVLTDAAGRTVISSNGFGPSGTSNTLSVGG